ncbi:MAG: endonuclease/exonuclease/phosphatase family protein [Paracoccaceae bacterium]
MTRRILTKTAWLAMFGLVAGFFASFHPSLDSLALLRPVFMLFCLTGVFAFRGVWLRMGLLAVLALSFATIVPMIGAVPVSSDLRVYSKNLRYDNGQVDALFQDIQAADADVLMLQEVSSVNEALLTLLRPAFPYQKRCSSRAGVAIVVASRFAFEGTPICSHRKALAVAKISIDKQSVWLASVHIPWHWPISSRVNEKEAEQVLGSLEGPIVMAGDFNSVPWTQRVSRLKTSSRTRLAGPTFVTLHHRRVPLHLPIDFVFSPGGGEVELRPLLGSDHHGLLADVQLSR